MNPEDEQLLSDAPPDEREHLAADLTAGRLTADEFMYADDHADAPMVASGGCLLSLFRRARGGPAEGSLRHTDENTQENSGAQRQQVQDL